MKKKLKILALFDAIVPTTLDQDLSAELKTDDWKTETNVLAALTELGHTDLALASERRSPTRLVSRKSFTSCRVGDRRSNGLLS